MAEARGVREALASGWIAGHGPRTRAFEEAFAGHVGAKHALAVNSGTAALFLAIKSLGITGEVILPSFTFVASANAVVTAGATPVFADIEPGRLTLDPSDVAAKITSRTEAIMPVHVAGCPCDMDAISRIAAKHGLAIIEDAAQATGARIGERHVGTYGAGCFSFFATKNMTTGEGGMLTTDDDRLARTARTLSAHGIAKPATRAAVLPGYNFRLSDLLAAVGLAQLGRLETMNARRSRHATRLSRELAGCPVHVPATPDGCTHVFQMYIIDVDPRRRNALLAHLTAHGVAATRFASPPVHLQPFYRRRYRDAGRGLPATLRAARGNLVLPMFSRLRRADTARVAALIREFLGNGAPR